MLLRIVTGVLLALAIAPAAQAGVCDERSVPPSITAKQRFERRLSDERRTRAGFGIPASRRSAVRGLRRGKHLPSWGLHLLPDELRFFRAYLRMEAAFSASDEARRVDGYVRAHRDEFGGSAFVSDYPRGLALRAHWTGHAARHRKRLRALTILPVRTRTVRYTEDELRHAQDRVERARTPRGIFVSSASTAFFRNRVEVEVISERPDAKQALERRLGPQYMVKVVARRFSRLACGRPERATVSANGLQVEMDLGTSGSVAVVKAFVAEEAGRVRVGIVLRVPTTFQTSDLAPHPATATLDEPLGDRKLVFAVDGRPIKRVKRMRPGEVLYDEAAFEHLRKRPRVVSWLGDAFEEQPLRYVDRYGTLDYGRCTYTSSRHGCEVPVEVVTDSPCETSPFLSEGRPLSLRVLGDGIVERLDATSVIYYAGGVATTVQADSKGRLERALAALRDLHTGTPLTEAGPPAAHPEALRALKHDKPRRYVQLKKLGTTRAQCPRPYAH